MTLAFVPGFPPSGPRFLGRFLSPVADGVPAAYTSALSRPGDVILDPFGQSPSVAVEAREVDVPGGGEEMSSPYVHDETLDLAGWARDAFALAMPSTILCRPECAGLCPVCAADLNEAGPEHHHESAPDPRWAKLRELKLE